MRILNQFEVMGNYRFHYYVTGNTMVDLAAELAEQGIGSGKVSAYVSAMGSAGTIAAGDRLKQEWHDHKIVGPGTDPVPDAGAQRLRQPRYSGHRRQARDLDSQRPEHGRDHVH